MDMCVPPEVLSPLLMGHFSETAEFVSALRRWEGSEADRRTASDFNRCPTACAWLVVL